MRSHRHKHRDTRKPPHGQANDSDRQHSRRMAQVACFFFVFSSIFFKNEDNGDRSLRPSAFFNYFLFFV